MVRGSVRRRLGKAIDRLAGAGAITYLDSEGFELTDRGAVLLANHPGGVDQSVLLTFPEFRAYVAAQRRPEPKEDPHLSAFEAGLRAFNEGQSRPSVTTPIPPTAPTISPGNVAGPRRGTGRCGDSPPSVPGQEAQQRLVEERRVLDEGEMAGLRQDQLAAPGIRAAISAVCAGSIASSWSPSKITVGTVIARSWSLV